MARIGKSFTFEAAHRLQNHGGKCRNLHGHSYRVEIAIQGELQEAGTLHHDTLGDTGIANPAEGMILDFGSLDGWWKPLDLLLDHVTLLQRGDPLVAALGDLAIVRQFDFPPTAEHIAAWILEELQMWLLRDIWPNQMIPTPTVRVYETAKSWAEG